MIQIEKNRSSCCGSVVMNPTSSQEDADLTSSLETSIYQGWGARKKKKKDWKTEKDWKKKSGQNANNETS